MSSDTGKKKSKAVGDLLGCLKLDTKQLLSINPFDLDPMVTASHNRSNFWLYAVFPVQIYRIITNLKSKTVEANKISLLFEMQSIHIPEVHKITLGSRLNLTIFSFLLLLFVVVVVVFFGEGGREGLVY